MRELVDLSPVLTELGRAVHRGRVRGAPGRRLGARRAARRAGRRRPACPGDLDVTTDARPEQILELLQGLGRFHVEHRHRLRHRRRRGATASRVEITTFRADRYDRESRNPEVAWGDSLVDDLVRRDFTVNAMAVSLGPDRTVTDPFGGLGDLLAKRLRTPGAAVDSFADDPLRMLRAVRFVAQLGLTPVDEVVEAMTVAVRRAGADHPRAGAGRAVEDAAAGRAPGGAGAVRRHRPGRRRPAGAARAAHGDRRAPPAQGRLHPLADRARPGDRAGEGRSGGGVAGPRAAAGGAAARHRQAGHPPARAARAGSPSTTTRWSARSWCASG